MVNKSAKSILCILTAVILLNFSVIFSVSATEEGGEEPVTPTTPTSTTTTSTTTASTTTSTTTITTTTTTSSTTTVSTTTPSTTKKTTTTTVKKSLSFKSDNTKNVEVSRSIVLYITSTGMNDLNTEFTCNDTTTATVLKINDSSVRVFGLKDGVVTISASSGKLTAKIKITVGKGEPAASTTTTTIAETVPTSETIPANILHVSSDETASDSNNVHKKDLTDEELFGNLKTDKKLTAATVITGVIWWGIVLVAVVVITLLVLNNNTGTMKLKKTVVSSYRTNGYKSYGRYFGGYNSGKRTGRKGKKGTGTKKHLLPDHYYRNLRKW